MFQSQIVCWCLAVMFALLAIAWGFVGIAVTNFSDATRIFLGIIALGFVFHAILFFVLAVEARKKRDNHGA